MQIDSDHPDLQVLVNEWRNLCRALQPGELTTVCTEYQRRLAKLLLLSMKRHKDEPVLLYHSFPTRVFSQGQRPLGSPMLFRKNHVIQIGRLGPHTTLMEKGRKESAKEFIACRHLYKAGGRQFLVTVRWQRPLYPHYSPDVPPHLLNFVLERRIKRKKDAGVSGEELPRTLDISGLGEHLFCGLSTDQYGRPLDEGQYQGTEVCVYVGMESVKQWLDQYASLEVFQELQMERRSRLR